MDESIIIYYISLESIQKFAWNNRIKPGLASDTVPVVLSQQNVEESSITPQKSRRVSAIMNNKSSNSLGGTIISQSLPSATSERRKSNPELIMGCINNNDHYIIYIASYTSDNGSTDTCIINYIIYSKSNSSISKCN